MQESFTGKIAFRVYYRIEKYVGVIIEKDVNTLQLKLLSLNPHEKELIGSTYYLQIVYQTKTFSKKTSKFILMKLTGVLKASLNENKETNKIHKTFEREKSGTPVLLSLSIIYYFIAALL